MSVLSSREASFLCAPIPGDAYPRVPVMLRGGGARLMSLSSREGWLTVYDPCLSTETSFWLSRSEELSCYTTSGVAPSTYLSMRGLESLILPGDTLEDAAFRLRCDVPVWLACRYLVLKYEREREHQRLGYIGEVVRGYVL